MRQDEAYPFGHTPAFDGLSQRVCLINPLLFNVNPPQALTNPIPDRSFAECILTDNKRSDLNGSHTTKYVEDESNTRVYSTCLPVIGLLPVVILHIPGRFLSDIFSQEPAHYVK